MTDATRGDRIAHEALASLPIRLRTPYVMRRMADASDRDISEALRVPPTWVARRVRIAERRLPHSFQQAGFSTASMDAALDTYLTIPPAADFVPRALAAIRRLPPHPAMSAQAESRWASRVAPWLTQAIIAVVVVATVMYYARMADSALSVGWPN